MGNLKLRLAGAEDAGAVSEIYRDYVAHTAVTFAGRAPSEEELRERIASDGAVYPVLVCEMEGRVLGFAYAARHMESAAFDFNAAVAMFVDKDAGGKGVGRALYDALERMLRAMGVINLYSQVAAPNPKAQHLHTAMGYMEAGRLHKAGFSQGRWRDVIFYEKSLALHDAAPKAVCPVRALEEAQIAECLRQGARLLRG